MLNDEQRKMVKGHFKRNPEATPAEKPAKKKGGAK